MAEIKELMLRLFRREIPVMVSAADEPRLRKAAQMVEQRIDEYKNRYNVSDEQYLLLMCALDVASDLVELQDSLEYREASHASQLAELEALVGVALEEIG